MVHLKTGKKLTATSNLMNTKKLLDSMHIYRENVAYIIFTPITSKEFTKKH